MTITLTREEAQQVLDALENLASMAGAAWTTDNPIETLRARLAQPEPAECDGGTCGLGGYCDKCPKTQPEPEPVAKNEGGKITWLVDNWPQNCLLYTTLPVSKSGDKKWVDEPQKVSAGAGSPMLFTYEQVKAHIKAALMSNNDVNVGDDVTKDGVSVVVRKNTEVLHAKFYPFPPQREWQGLTDEEISELIRNTHNTGSFVRAIEAKLKEKNA
jgi:hypothetical protein